MIKKVVTNVTETQVQEDLEKYRKRALELGATGAKVITTDMILIDERVRAKCIYPKCYFYGTNAQCPPHAMDLDMARKITKKFHYAIFTRVEVPSNHIAGPEAYEKGLMVPFFLKTYKIVSRIESEAFFDGYYLSLGLGCGPCKPLFCPNHECSALTDKGCRHPMRSRTSMEGFGINVYNLVTEVGWDIYPIGGSISPADVPCGGTYGLVFIY